MFAQPAAGQSGEGPGTRALTEYCCPSDNWVTGCLDKTSKVFFPSVWQPETMNDNIERCVKKGDSRTDAQIFVLLISRHLFDPSSADWWTKRGLLMVVMTIIVTMIMITMRWLIDYDDYGSADDGISDSLTPLFFLLLLAIITMIIEIIITIIIIWIVVMSSGWWLI